MLSNTATPIYYAEFRRKVQSGELPVNYKILQQMDRIEKKIASPVFYQILRSRADAYGRKSDDDARYI